MNTCACSYMVNVYVGVSCMRKKEGGRKIEKIGGGREEREAAGTVKKESDRERENAWAS